MLIKISRFNLVRKFVLFGISCLISSYALIPSRGYTQESTPPKADIKAIQALSNDVKELARKYAFTDNIFLHLQGVNAHLEGIIFFYTDKNVLNGSPEVCIEDINTKIAEVLKIAIGTKAIYGPEHSSFRSGIGDLKKELPLPAYVFKGMKTRFKYCDWLQNLMKGVADNTQIYDLLNSAWIRLKLYTNNKKDYSASYLVYSARQISKHIDRAIDMANIKFKGDKEKIDEISKKLSIVKDRLAEMGFEISKKTLVPIETLADKVGDLEEIVKRLKKLKKESARFEKLFYNIQIASDKLSVIIHYIKASPGEKATTENTMKRTQSLVDKAMQEVQKITASKGKIYEPFKEQVVSNLREIQLGIPHISHIDEVWEINRRIEFLQRQTCQYDALYNVFEEMHMVLKIYVADYGNDSKMFIDLQQHADKVVGYLKRAIAFLQSDTVFVSPQYDQFKERFFQEITLLLADVDKAFGFDDPANERRRRIKGLTIKNQLRRADPANNHYDLNRITVQAEKLSDIAREVSFNETLFIKVNMARETLLTYVHDAKNLVGAGNDFETTVKNVTGFSREALDMLDGEVSGINKPELIRERLLAAFRDLPNILLGGNRAKGVAEDYEGLMLMSAGNKKLYKLIESARMELKLFLWDYTKPHRTGLDFKGTSERVIHLVNISLYFLTNSSKRLTGDKRREISRTLRSVADFCETIRPQSFLTHTASPVDVKAEQVSIAGEQFNRFKGYISKLGAQIVLVKESEGGLGVDEQGLPIKGTTGLHPDRAPGTLLVKLLVDESGNYVERPSLLHEQINCRLLTEAFKRYGYGYVYGTEGNLREGRASEKGKEAEFARLSLERDGRRIMVNLYDTSADRLESGIETKVSELFDGYEVKYPKLAEIRAENEKIVKDAIRQIEKELTEKEKPSFGKKAAGKGYSLAHTIAFITILEVANKVKELLGEGRSWNDLTLKEQTQLIGEAAANVVTSMDIYAGIAGSSASGGIAKNIVQVKSLSGLRAAVAGQTLSVITYAGWMMTQRLYMDATRDLPPQAHNIINLVRDEELAKAVWRSLKEKIASEEYLHSFEMAVYKGLLTGDAAFFLAFTAAGTKIGTMVCPGWGTAIGSFIGGATGAVVSLFVPESGKSWITDIAGNLEKWKGQLEIYNSRGRISRYAPYYSSKNDNSLLFDAIDEEENGRNKIMDYLIGVYGRNLQLWVVNEELLKEYETELAVLNDTGKASPERSMQTIKSFKPDEDEEFTYKRELTASEIESGIAGDIAESEGDVSYHKNKVQEAYEHMMRFLNESYWFYQGQKVSVKDVPAVTREADRITRQKDLITEIMNPEVLALDLSADLPIKFNLTRAFKVLMLLLQFEYTWQELEKGNNPGWVNPDNLQYWEAAN